MPTPSLIEQVKRAVDIRVIVGEVVTLTRRGRRLYGRCPFHDDHNPSFFVDDQANGKWRCWSESIHGDVIDFVARQRDLTAADALRVLMDRAGIRAAHIEPPPAGPGPEWRRSLARAEFETLALRLDNTTRRWMALRTSVIDEAHRDFLLLGDAIHARLAATRSLEAFFADGDYLDRFRFRRVLLYNAIELPAHEWAAHQHRLAESDGRGSAEWIVECQPAIAPPNAEAIITAAMSAAEGA